MYQVEDDFWWYAGLRNLIRNTILTHAAPHPRLLDAGCGTGAVMKYLGDMGDYIGVDYSLSALKFCRQRNLNRIMRSSIMTLPFKSGSFDVVTSIDVLYHQGVADDDEALAELYRVLKPGGILITNLPAYESLRSSHDEAIHTRTRYRRLELTHKFVRAGFRVVKNSYRNTFLFPAALLTRYLRKGDDSRQSDLEELPRSINRIFTAILNLENVWLRSYSFPFGLSIYTVAQKP